MTPKERADALWDICTHYYGGVCPMCVASAIRDAVEAEREEVAQEVDRWAAQYPESVFATTAADLESDEQASGYAGTVMRTMLPRVAAAIRGRSKPDKGEGS